MTKEKKAIYGWALYDWANSSFMTTVIAGFFPIFFKNYYSHGMDPTVSTAKLGVANSLGTLFVALIGPTAGAIADRGSLKKKMLVSFAFLGILMTCALAMVGQGEWLLASIIFVIGNVGHASSCSFYDSLLPSVANEKNIDYVSALGYSLGYLGGGILFAVNVFMYQKPELFGFADGATAIRGAFVSVAVWWALFTSPIIVWVKESPVEGPKMSLIGYSKEGIKSLKETLLHLKQMPTLVFFLSAFLIYNDAVGTTIKMAVDYGMSIGFQPSDLILALLLTQFVGFPAALLFGKFSHKYHPKTGIFFSIAVYIFVVIWASQMKAPWEFYFLACIIGLVQGGIQALSRSYYSRLIPLEKSGEFYGFYNLLGKFAGLFGPLLIGFVSVTTGSHRIGIASITVMFIVGAALLKPVNEAQGQIEIQKLKTR